MKLRLALIGAAALLGLAAATIAVKYTEGVREDLRKGTNPVKVLVTVRPVPAGLTLQELKDRRFVEVRNIPKQFVPQGALGPSASTGDKILATKLAEGEELTMNKFESPREAGLASTTPKDFVAITISTEEMPTLASLVKVGDHVNIVGTARNPQGIVVVDTIVIDAPVLAVGASIKNEVKKEGALGTGSQESNKKDVKSITFAGTELEAEKVALFKEAGHIWVSILPKSKAADSGEDSDGIGDATKDADVGSTADVGSSLGGIQ